MKLKYTKRPVQSARKFAEEVSSIFPRDLCGMSMLAMVGKWAAIRNARPLQRLQKRRRLLKGRMDHVLGIVIASILSVAHKEDVILTFNAMDGFIETEKKNGTKKVDWALGVFCSYFSKWCTNVTCYKEPDDGMQQMLLQGMLNSVGLMCFLSKRDPIVDCFLPVYKNLNELQRNFTSRKEKTRTKSKGVSKHT